MSGRYGQSYRNGGYGGFGRPEPLRQERERAPPMSRPQQQQQQQQQLQPPQQQRDGGADEYDDYDPFGDGYGGSQGGGGRDRFPTQQSSQQSLHPRGPMTTRTQPRSRSQQPGYETNAERELNKVLEHIRQDWPGLLQADCNVVQLALQLLDNSSVGRAHEYRDFQRTHQLLQSALKNIVHDYHQGFNSSIGTFHKIQGSIQTSQKRLRALKESLAASRSSLTTTDPELKKLYAESHMYGEALQALGEIQELVGVPDQLEATISEKRFLTAVEFFQNALRKLRKPELDEIGALSDIRIYLANQDTALEDILVEELHEHLYLKSPYCQERWQTLAKDHGVFKESYSATSSIVPFLAVLDGLDPDVAVAEDPQKNPEADTFYYITLLVEALNKLGRLESAVDTLKQRLPVELFGVVNDAINDIDQKHPSSLRGGSNGSHGLHIYGRRETQMRADVIYDLLWTLYGKFEAIAEGHRVFHEAVKALIRREGAGNNSALLGSFKELWNLYQNEIRSLLHNYVTTDADVYQFHSNRPGMGANGRGDAKRDNLFRFGDTDPKSIEMGTEYEALDNIIRTAVPGLTSTSRKGPDSKKLSLLGSRPDAKGSRSAYGSAQSGGYKSLVEPSVFNMSLLLPPTLVFLQRLKNIVPPGSDLATSTLTSFLDNFLVNVFQPQLDETLNKLCDTVFGEADAFQQDPDWALVAKRPVFKGTTAFYTVITAFCRMLGTIPHDQALSSLIVTQMLRYYDRCYSWYKALVTKTQEDSSEQVLKASAAMATEPGEMREVMQKLWTSDDLDQELLEKEVALLTMQCNEKPLEPSDVIQDRDAISSLCLLYTSMKWLSVKVAALRHITKTETDSSRSGLGKPDKKRWTLLDDPSKATSEQGPVYIPMTQENVQSFDGLLTSYEELAATSLLTLHMEIRCRIVLSLQTAMSPDTAPYLLDQDVNEPDPEILALNAELIAYDETAARFLRDRQVAFVRSGLGLLTNTYLISNALRVGPMNAKGCGRMQLNILVLQQNLKNIEDGVDLMRAATYFELFDQGVDAIIAKAKEGADPTAEGAGQDPNHFTYDELKALVELCYSEQLHHQERGIAAAAKRQMSDKLLNLSEYMWQS